MTRLMKQFDILLASVTYMFAALSCVQRYVCTSCAQMPISPRLLCDLADTEGVCPMLYRCGYHLTHDGTICLVPGLVTVTSSHSMSSWMVDKLHGRCLLLHVHVAVACCCICCLMSSCTVIAMIVHDS